MDTLWITSASLSLTTSSRASSTSTPPAKHQRPCSRTALSSHVPTALHHTFLSLSVSPSLSPSHGLSLSALTLCSAATSRDRRHSPRGMVWSFFFMGGGRSVGTHAPLVLSECDPRRRLRDQSWWLRFCLLLINRCSREGWVAGGHFPSQPNVMSSTPHNVPS